MNETTIIFSWTEELDKLISKLTYLKAAELAADGEASLVVYLGAYEWSVLERSIGSRLITVQATRRPDTCLGMPVIKALLPRHINVAKLQGNLCDRI